MSRSRSERDRKTVSRTRSLVNRKEGGPSNQEPRVLTTMRLRRSLRKELETTALRTRRSVADVAQELLDEALRVRQCPSIYFADEPRGRPAKIGETGVGVWEILRDFTSDQSSARIRKSFPQLSQAQVTAALMYYSRYRDEVRAKVDANAALTPESIGRRFPGLVQFTR